MGETRAFITLKTEGSASLVEKKSEFIGFARPVRSEAEALSYLAALRKAHPAARHHVYAYIVDGAMRYSDDGEPQGTGGVPVLDLLRKSGLEGAVVVVVRYFGGILLGAGGLVRAYSAAAKLALEQAQTVQMQPFTEARLLCSYSDYQRVQRELERFHAKLDGCEYTDVVALSVAVRSDCFEALQNDLTEWSAGRLSLVSTGSRYDSED